MRCPCRKKSEIVAYAACCGPYHDGTALPPTAEALMRSRYAAFVLLKREYILATWHPSTRPTYMPLDAGETWLALKISDGTADGDRATVTFTARSMIGGRSQIIQEVSRFVRENGKWFYVRAESR